MAPLLPVSAVSVEVEEEKKQQPPFPSLRDIIIWALLHAGCAAFSIAHIFVVTSIGHPPSWMLPRNVEVTKADVVATLVPVMLWSLCVVCQAAAGALALALPRHRLLLAFAALLTTAASHFIWAGVYIFSVAADPGVLLRSWTGVNTVAFLIISGAGDVLCFRGLLRGPDLEELELAICRDILMHAVLSSGIH